VRVKASWSIEAGIIPGEAMKEFSRNYCYTSAMDEEDRKNNPVGDPAYHSLLCKMRAEAMDYYLQVSNPQILNWARITFLWY
jgi:hypothetical protein